MCVCVCKNISTMPEKLLTHVTLPNRTNWNCLYCRQKSFIQNYFARLTPPNSPDFGHFISLDEMNSMFSFFKYFFFIFGCCFLPEKFSDCPNNIALPDLVKMQTPHPSDRTPILTLLQREEEKQEQEQDE